MARATPEELAAEAAAVEAAAAPRFARWDPGAWRRHVAGPFRIFAVRTPTAAVRKAYLTLSAEALGLGLLDREGFARWMILRHLPYQSGVEVPTLAALWNVAEGLAAAPLWLQRLASASVTAPTTALPQVAATLQRALGEVPPARFSGPFRLVAHGPPSTTFLPGALHFVAPRVLCVHDRLRAGAHAAWELGDEVRGLGEGGCLGDPFVAPTPPVTLRSVYELRVGDQPVALPQLKLHGAPAVSPAGFVAFAVVDSQRLWVASSP